MDVTIGPEVFCRKSAVLPQFWKSGSYNGDSRSHALAYSNGVVQGSVLGPFLFVLFVRSERLLITVAIGLTKT